MKSIKFFFFFFIYLEHICSYHPPSCIVCFVKTTRLFIQNMNCLLTSEDTPEEVEERVQIGIDQEQVHVVHKLHRKRFDRLKFYPMFANLFLFLYYIRPSFTNVNIRCSSVSLDTYSSGVHTNCLFFHKLSNILRSLSLCVLSTVSSTGVVANFV